MKRKQHPLALWLLISLLLFSLLFSGCSADSNIDPDAGADSSDTSNADDLPGILSSFQTTTLTGKSVDQTILEDYDLTMVNVWATYCTPCITEMPYISGLVEEYEEKGVQILGLVSDVLASDGSLDPKQVELAEDVVEQTGAENYNHLMADVSLYGLLSQIYAVPTTFFVDSEGNQVGSAYVQMLTEEQFRTVIDEALSGLSGSESGVQ